MIIYKYKANAFNTEDITQSISSCTFYLKDNGIQMSNETTEINGDYIGQIITDKSLSIRNIQVLNEIFDDNGCFLEIDTFDFLGN